MSKQVPWTKELLESFITEAMLTEREELIMRTRCAEWTRLQQADRLNLSLSTVDRTIADLKLKYDNMQRLHPDKYPKRTKSKKETWMDTH